MVNNHINEYFFCVYNFNISQLCVWQSHHQCMQLITAMEMIKKRVVMFVVSLELIYSVVKPREWVTIFIKCIKGRMKMLCWMKIVISVYCARNSTRSVHQILHWSKWYKILKIWFLNFIIKNVMRLLWAMYRRMNRLSVWPLL